MANDSAKLDDLLNALAEEIGDDKDKGRNAALKILDRDDGLKYVVDTYQKKYLGKRTAAEAEKATALQTQLKEAQDELAEARAHIKELEAKEPNWERRLEDERKKWQQKLDAAESKVMEERSVSLRDKVDIERAKFRNALRIGLPGGVEEEYGELLPAKFESGITADPESRVVKVRELGETDSYYDPAEGDPIEQYARDVLAKVPPKYRIQGEPEVGGGVGGGRAVDKAAAAVMAAKRQDPLYSGL